MQYCRYELLVAVGYSKVPVWWYTVVIYCTSTWLLYIPNTLLRWLTVPSSLHFTIPVVVQSTGNRYRCQYSSSLLDRLLVASLSLDSFRFYFIQFSFIRFSLILIHFQNLLDNNNNNNNNITHFQNRMLSEMKMARLQTKDAANIRFLKPKAFGNRNGNLR